MIITEIHKKTLQELHEHTLSISFTKNDLKKGLLTIIPPSDFPLSDIIVNLYNSKHELVWYDGGISIASNKKEKISLHFHIFERHNIKGTWYITAHSSKTQDKK